jgi:hypothetical protein
MKMVCVAWRISTLGECRQDWKEEITGTNTTTLRNSWVFVPMGVASVARKLCMIEKQLQDQICMFRRDDYNSKGHNAEKLLGSGSDLDGFSSWEAEHQRRPET